MRQNWIERDLLIVVVLTLILILIIAAFPVTALCIALGLPIVLFFPGYVLIAALFPRKESLDGLEHIALSFGLSIAVTALIGFIFSYTPWGIRLYPILLSQSFFIFAMSGIAWYKRKRLPPEERFSVPWLYRLPSIKLYGEGRWDKFLSVILIILIAGAIGTFVYTIAAPKIGEKFTEIYILGINGKADGYPKEFTLDDNGKVIRVKYVEQNGVSQEIEEGTGKVTLGVVNHEQERTDYVVELKIGGEPKPIEMDGTWHDELSFSLDNEEKWEHKIGFAPDTVGVSQKVEFLLFKDGGGESDSVYLAIDVKPE